MIVRVWCESGAGWSAVHVPVTPQTSCLDVVECCREPGDDPCLLMSVHPHHGAFTRITGVCAATCSDECTAFRHHSKPSCLDVLDCYRESGDDPCVLMSVHPHHGGVCAATCSDECTAFRHHSKPSCLDVLDCYRELGDDPCVQMSVHPHHGGMCCNLEQ
ncbi:unnamed protein product [Chilo suppressalis]|uniref:Apoptosis-stimulating of p53 protein 2-like RA domain-containing protein n=1 Tax=Chilo suppressalis TaxID=168631 RepID=A0ABN8AV66_CHISP|nr:unnamed protein product [Chilo suppressalis]